MIVLKICGIAVLGLVAVVLLRGMRAEYATFAGIITGILLLFTVLAEFSSVMALVEEMTEKTGFSLYFEVILKAMGLGMLAEVTADICRDNGATAIASKVEFAHLLLKAMLYICFLSTNIRLGALTFVGSLFT